MVKHPGTHNRRKHLSVLNLKGQLLEPSERYSQGRERAVAPLGAMLLEEENSASATKDLQVPPTDPH